ncbi:hypothetical protein AX15_000672 [Amanita polypyramis BW_CC]|nr:hypothetical protein AX15_000672 [Amanita polypyramis BW_CC]
MATRQSDQQRVCDLALQYPDNVIPCFGYHPWFSHVIAVQPFASKRDHYRTLLLGASIGNPEHEDHFERLLPHLPEPRPLDDVVAELRSNLQAFPNAMLGEVGLDRSFRVPIDYFSSPRVLTPFTIPLEHQLVIAEAQIELAIELGRNVSFHSVKSQQVTTTLLNKMRDNHGERWCRISIDMHSCGLSPETWRSIENEHTNAFMSLSVVINGRNSGLRRLIATCASDRILAESDYDNAEMTTQMTWEMLSIIAEVRGWQLEQDWVQDQEMGKVGVVRQLEANWKRFKEGNHPFRGKGRKKS